MNRNEVQCISSKWQFQQQLKQCKQQKRNHIVNFYYKFRLLRRNPANQIWLGSVLRSKGAPIPSLLLMTFTNDRGRELNPLYFPRAN